MKESKHLYIGFSDLEAALMFQYMPAARDGQ